MFQESYMRKIAALVGIMAIVALSAYAYSTIKQTRYMYQGPTTISVTGKGEVTATPDIASFGFSLEAMEVDAQTAQNKVSEQVKNIVAYLKENGVEEKDIKTENHSLSEWYEHPQSAPCTPWSCPPQGEPVRKGYIVHQYVTVKVRDTGKTGEILSGVGDRGAQNVSGLTLTIDDEEKYKAEAREKAIVDAREKARALAEDLGVHIVRMNGYWENQGGTPMPYGRGGDMAAMMDAKAESMPSQPAVIQTGENTFTVEVSIAYEVKGRGAY